MFVVVFKKKRKQEKKTFANKTYNQHQSKSYCEISKSVNCIGSMTFFKNWIRILFVTITAQTI